MKTENTIINFLQSVVKQDKTELKEYFTDNAEILWFNSNEKFNVDEYIIANCEYPGTWDGKVERIDKIGEQYVAVSLIWTADKKTYFRVVSYFTFLDGKILSLHEYFGDCADAPKWRLDMKIGQPII